MRLSLLDNRRKVLLYLDENKTIPKYTVTWKNWDGSDLYVDTAAPEGGIPAYAGPTPTKPSTTQYRYNFTGWNPNPAIIYEDTVYTAQFQELPNTVTATYVKDSSDGGGTIKTITVNYGETPVYDGAAPTTTKGTAEIFPFEGWEPELGPITADTVYTAKFGDLRPYAVKFLARDIKEYTDTHEALTEANVTWLNWDGELLELDKDVPIGTTPTYNGATPTRPAVPGYIYTFAGWDKQIVPLTGFTTYTATYTEVIETHKATFVKASADGGGTLQTINAVPYNTTPNYTAATPTTTKGDATMFPFIGWDPPLGPMITDTTYTAVFDDLRPYAVRFLARDITEYEG